MSVSMEERIYRQLIELIGIPSVTGSEGEKEITRFICNSLAKEDYFREHPDHLNMVPGPDGKRCSLVAMVRSATERAETVLCIGHLDVVDADVYGDLAKDAFDPESLERALRGLLLDGTVKDDLESGNWIFGRGVMDMKCGLSIELDMLREFARDRRLFNINLVVAAVFDEEGSNQGMISTVPFLHDLSLREGLRYIGAVDTEPTDAGLPGVSDPGYFLSTMGKALAMVYTVGEEAHGGSYYSGISASFMQDYINGELEARPELGDSSRGNVAIPPFVLHRQCRYRENYSVSIPRLSVAYYNVFSVGRAPKNILGSFKKAAARGMEKIVSDLERSHEMLKAEGYRGTARRQKRIPVIEYAKLREEAGRNYPGDFEEAENGWLSELAASGADLREQCIGLVERMLPWLGDKGPVVIVGLLPPYMPFRSSYGDSDGEKRLRRAAEATASYAKEMFGRDLPEYPAFGGLCDLSYVGCEMAEDDRQTLRENIPGWGTLYTLPLESMEKLDIPIINLGPLGRDAHTWRERLERQYALRELPHILRFFIRQLAKEYQNDEPSEK